MSGERRAKVVSLYRRQEEIQRDLLEDMEISSRDLRAKQEVLNRIGAKAMQKFEEALDRGLIPPYKAVLAHGRLVDSLVKMEATRFALYDRLQGTIGTHGPVEEEESDNVVDFQVEREAERLCREMVKGLVDRKRAGGTGGVG